MQKCSRATFYIKYHRFHLNLTANKKRSENFVRLSAMPIRDYGFSKFPCTIYFIHCDTYTFMLCTLHTMSYPC